MTRLYALLALLASLVGGCATGTAYVPQNAPAAVAPAPVKVGDFWEYAVRDAYTGFDRGVFRYTVSHVEPNRIVADVTRDGERVDSYAYAPGWNGIEHPLTNLQRFRFAPAFPAYDYPLVPGKRWYTVVNATDPVTRQTYSVHTQGKVVGWERIRVPAGEFDALKIQRYVFAGNSDARRTQESIAETDWYVPALGRAARMQGSSEHFDTSYGGGDDGGEYPQRIRGDWLIAELVRQSR
jgi:hypothetical protein